MKLSFLSLWLLLLLVFSLSAYSQTYTYYIVRHAEKAQTGSDPPLSRQGQRRAQALKELLKNKKIGFIFSTNTIRTLSTAKPLSEAIHVPVQIYAQANSAFIRKVKGLHKNTLIVGHSNTIDDIANALSNALSVSGDIPDSEYNNLFIVKYIGKKIEFEAKKY